MVLLGYSEDDLTPSEMLRGMVQVLLNFCRSVLKAKPTSIKEDEELLRQLKQEKPSCQQEERRLLAVQYRYGKKKILQSCIRKHQKLAYSFSS